MTMSKEEMDALFYRDFDSWLHEVRLQLYEETKHMTKDERREYLDERSTRVMKEFNLKYSTLTPVIPHVRQRKPA